MSAWQKIKGWFGLKPQEPGKPKLPKPKDVLPAVGRDLVTVYHIDPDRVWSLKCVIRPLDGVNMFHLFRVFSDKQAYSAGVKVLNYDSLDYHPELVLYSGRVNKANSHVEFTDNVRRADKPTKSDLPPTQDSPTRKAA